MASPDFVNITDKILVHYNFDFCFGRFLKWNELMSYEILEVMCAIYSCKGLTAIRCNENMMFVIDEHL